eukprot:CAMPEP_0179092500 /NCGR_PEP_ID=MMETSP0796-20121207/42309_1 /TAXON_ID=73915 /ORGANISM="Pyrodinium bahamense, Strain pbaha01" /LENGTH=197 /DNA_ID=CAMNT_0020790107 /DNA_START=361 /DNA_END=952 /DNA_ORIENTATION=-
MQPAASHCSSAMECGCCGKHREQEMARGGKEEARVEPGDSRISPREAESDVGPGLILFERLFQDDQHERGKEEAGSAACSPTPTHQPVQQEQPEQALCEEHVDMPKIGVHEYQAARDTKHSGTVSSIAARRSSWCFGLRALTCDAGVAAAMMAGTGIHTEAMPMKKAANVWRDLLTLPLLRDNPCECQDVHRCCGQQ